MEKSISFEEKRSCLLFYALGALMHLACVALIVLFITGNITLGFGLEDDSEYPISLQFLAVMLLGAAGCVIMILGERRYFADRGVRAPFIFMLIPQILFMLFAAILLIYPALMVASADMLLISAGLFIVMSLLIAIAKMVVGIKLMTKKHVCFGVLLVLTAVGILILLGIRYLGKEEMQMYDFTASDLSIWIYLGFTALETLCALVMFLTNKCCCKGKCKVPECSQVEIGAPVENDPDAAETSNE